MKLLYDNLPEHCSRQILADADTTEIAIKINSEFIVAYRSLELQHVCFSFKHWRKWIIK